MTEEYAEKKGWFGGFVPVTVRVVCSNALPHVEPYTSDDLDELYEKVKEVQEDKLPPGFWSNPNYLGTGE